MSQIFSLFPILLLLLSLSGCAKRSADNMGQELLEAADEKQPERGREVAASKLNAADREKLRRILEARLPGGLDTRTLDNILILGVVGDSRTVSCLNHFRNSEPLTGKMNNAVEMAIASIESRGK
jgi:hypothetical protein